MCKNKIYRTDKETWVECTLYTRQDTAGGWPRLSYELVKIMQMLNIQDIVRTEVMDDGLIATVRLPRKHLAAANEWAAMLSNVKMFQVERNIIMDLTTLSNYDNEASIPQKNC